MTDGILCTLNFAPDMENHSADSTFRRLFSQLRKFCGLGTPIPSPTSPPPLSRVGRAPAGRLAYLGVRGSVSADAGAAERKGARALPPSVPPPEPAARSPQPPRPRGLYRPGRPAPGLFRDVSAPAGRGRLCSKPGLAATSLNQLLAIM